MRLRFRNKRRRPTPVIFKDPDGRTLPAYAVRAGMTIVGTDYRHSDRSLVCVVKPNPQSDQIGSYPPGPIRY